MGLVILDHRGKEISTEMLKKEHSPVREGDYVDEGMFPGGILGMLTPARVLGLMQLADEGEPEAFLTLAELMEEIDGHYRSVISTRRLMVSSAPRIVIAAGDSEAQKQQRDAVQQLIESDACTDLVFHCTDGIAKGYAITEILWDFDAKGPARWMPRGYRWRDPRRFELDPLNAKPLRYKDGSRNGKPLPPGKYVVHHPRLKNGPVIRGGIARAAAVPFVCKRQSARDMMRFLEQYGIPPRIGRYASGASRRDIKSLMGMLGNLGSDGYAAISEKVKLELLEAKGGSAGSFIDAAKYWDQQISKVVLGQTMTADDGASKSQATVHNMVRLDIAQHDAQAISTDINACLIRPFIDLNFGPPSDGLYPRFSIVIREKENLAALMNVVAAMVDRGALIDGRELRERVGFSTPDADAELLEPITKQRPADEGAKSKEGKDAE